MLMFLIFDFVDYLYVDRIYSSLSIEMYVNQVYIKHSFHQFYKIKWRKSKWSLR